MASDEVLKPEAVLRVRDVALHLGCTSDTVYGLVNAGEMRAIRVGRLLRIPESSLRDFIARGA
ncbi:helix-turn-helix domain-containing protein [Demequina oxidasica]|uniref:helix-turn-helix domain-containing protein n=1 Tax=Demequina oxidasica TaxID=676199 RepID=UPI000783405B|nr:helix-turn-helix domain-containing protein [Demequina oxidasica]